MKKAILIPILFLILVASSTAEDGWFLNEQNTIWADIIDQPNFFSATQANITIRAPNTATIITNAPMLLVSTGRFAYNFTPTATGNWYASVEYYNTTGKIATASQTIGVEKIISMTEIAIALLFMAIVGFVLILANKEYKEAGLHRIFGVFLYIISVWMFGGIVFYLSELTRTSPFASITNWFLIAYLVLAVMFTVLFIALSFIDMTKKSVEMAGGRKL